MSDFDDQDGFMSLDDLDNEEQSAAGVGSDDWGDSFDDMDSEAWDNEYHAEDEELEDDPWALG